MDKFKNSKSILTYLYFNYDVKGHPMAFGGIKPDKILKFKEETLKNHDQQELSVIKSSLKTQVSVFKSMSIIITVISFVLTIILNSGYFFQQLYIKPIDWTQNAEMILLKEETSDDKFIALLKEQAIEKDVEKSAEKTKEFQISSESEKAAKIQKILEDNSKQREAKYNEVVNNQKKMFESQLKPIQKKFDFQLILVLVVPVSIVALFIILQNWAEDLYNAIEDACESREKKNKRLRTPRPYR